MVVHVALILLAAGCAANVVEGDTAPDYVAPPSFLGAAGSAPMAPVFEPEPDPAVEPEAPVAAPPAQAELPADAGAPAPSAPEPAPAAPPPPAQAAAPAPADAAVPEPAAPVKFCHVPGRSPIGCDEESRRVWPYLVLRWSISADATTSCDVVPQTPCVSGATCTIIDLHDLGHPTTKNGVCK